VGGGGAEEAAVWRVVERVGEGVGEGVGEEWGGRVGGGGWVEGLTREEVGRGGGSSMVG